MENGNLLLTTRQAYDNVNRPVYQAWQLGNRVYTEGYTYHSDKDGALNVHTTANGDTLTMGYDGLRRLTSVDSVEDVADKVYTYRVVNQNTTTQVTELKYPNLQGSYSFNYTYDNMGNIASYRLDCPTANYSEAEFRYTYDPQGQLTQATDGTVTFTYEYDTVGNITEANGHTYTYGNADWKDLLTAYDGQSITYDAMGNPTSYYNGTHWNFTWEHGRRLATASNGTNNISYTYDSDGIRTSKTVNGVVYN